MSRLLSVLFMIGSVFGADRAGADMRSGIIPPSDGAKSAFDEPALLAASKPLSAQRPKMLLKLGSIKTDPEFASLTESLESASRQALAQLPGVRLLERAEDADAAAARRSPPVVMITGKLAELGQREEGAEILISARVEYFVHRMPGQSIAAVVSGVASARVPPVQMKKRYQRERLERALITAAVESAVKRSAPALKAAAD